MIVDLHIHSDESDSTLAAPEIIEQAKRAGLELISITDHDTTVGQDLNRKLAHDAGIAYIKGIEISAYDKQTDTQVHILGYDYKNDALLDDFCTGINARRKEAGIIMTEQIIAAGYKITVDDVLKYTKSGIIYRFHIVHALAARGFGDLSLYTRLFGKPGIAHAPFEYADATEAVAVVREAGGLAVIAHPAEYNNWHCIERLADTGLVGLELHHPRHTSRDATGLLDAAQKYGLFTTSGSDFHGMYVRNPVPIGYGCTAAPEEILHLLS